MLWRPYNWGSDVLKLLEHFLSFKFLYWRFWLFWDAYNWGSAILNKCYVIITNKLKIERNKIVSHMYPFLVDEQIVAADITPVDVDCASVEVRNPFEEST